MNDLLINTKKFKGNKSHLDILLSSINNNDILIWNKWRSENSSIEPDLSGIKLRYADLHGANFNGVKIFEAELFFNNFNGSSFADAQLPLNYFNKSTFIDADLTNAQLGASGR